VEDGVAAGHRVLEGGLVADVDGDETPDTASARLEPVARRFLIADQELRLVARCEQGQRGVRPNKTGRAGAEDLHVRPIRTRI